MTFAHPYLLLSLLLLPAVAWLRGRRGPRPAFVYSSVQLVRGITGITRSHAGVNLLRLRWLVLALFLIGLARPQLGEGESQVRASGIDIVVAVDVSSSMSSEDFLLAGKPVNRLVMEKAVLEQFIAKRPNDRLGLVAFAQRPYIASPLTLDHEFLRQNLARLQIATGSEDGTAIGSALVAALNRLRELKSKSKIIILMTDGQNNAGKVPPLTAAEAAEKLGVKAYTIGVGTRGLARAPVYNEAGQLLGYQRMPVNIDEDTLQRIATRTGGRYYRADKTETLQAIYDEIDKMEKTEVEVKKYQYYRELFPWFVLPGVALLLLEVILAHTVWRTLP